MRFLLRILPLGLLAGYWAALCAGTHLPAGRVGGLLLWDKLLHFTAFAGLAFLAALALTAFRRFTWRSAAAILLIAAAYGLADEWTQTFVPGRSADVRDFLADVLGAAAGLALFAAAGAVWRFMTPAEETAA